MDKVGCVDILWIMLCGYHGKNKGMHQNIFHRSRDPTEMEPSPVKIGQGFIIAVKKTTVPPRGKIACMEKFQVDSG